MNNTERESREALYALASKQYKRKRKETITAEVGTAIVGIVLLAIIVIARVWH